MADAREVKPLTAEQELTIRTELGRVGDHWPRRYGVSVVLRSIFASLDVARAEAAAYQREVLAARAWADVPIGNPQKWYAPWEEYRAARAANEAREQEAKRE